ncbi:hypothetical protein [Staphylococcus hominis]|uniref:hypothetical protein n=1 Tax=Staphylococcus hominis TaxID=1290 RepID=UPI002878EC3C|nr:hypothetical protein [Staphylococcus hominis]MDS3837833.1 hypothetical protein [Staphylococcus hominis]
MNAEAKFVSSVMDARLKKAKRERDAYKKQRDELINDMAEVKRKAEILDKLEEMFETSANANRKHGFNGGAEFYERYLDIIRERGSDE